MQRTDSASSQNGLYARREVENQPGRNLFAALLAALRAARQAEFAEKLVLIYDGAMVAVSDSAVSGELTLGLASPTTSRRRLTALD
jgi:hypothetical protein